MRYSAVLLFGAPGAGKGTQGAFIASLPGFYHHASGDIFRALDKRSPVGRLFTEYSSQGKLVPDEVTITVWKSYIEARNAAGAIDPRSHILLMDGIPRNLAQAKLIESTVDVLKVLYLVCTDVPAMIKRLRLRAAKENRIDDASDEVIEARMHVFEAETKPMLEYYPPERIATINANNSPIRVLSDILHVLAPLKDDFDEARMAV